MADRERVLSQEQIDAMLAGGADGGPSGAPANPPPVNLNPTNLEAIRAKEEATSAARAGDNAALNDLAARVARLEASASQDGSGAASPQQLLVQIQELASKVASIMTGMQGTVGYAARQNFVCSSCQQQGNVAVKLNCTSCGQENMWGWWPAQP